MNGWWEWKERKEKKRKKGKETEGASVDVLAFFIHTHPIDKSRLNWLFRLEIFFLFFFCFFPPSAWSRGGEGWTFVCQGR